MAQSIPVLVAVSHGMARAVRVVAAHNAQADRRFWPAAIGTVCVPMMLGAAPWAVPVVFALAAFGFNRHAAAKARKDPALRAFWTTHRIPQWAPVEPATPPSLFTPALLAALGVTTEAGAYEATLAAVVTQRLPGEEEAPPSAAPVTSS